MKIALVGTRGIPARYGGFETFAEEISRRLVARGHEVRVYCRQRFSAPTYLGVDLCYLPTIRHKYFDTVVHTILCTLHLTVKRVDVALYCNAANAICIFVPRITGTPTALNVDGLERNRKKWNRLGQLWYLMSERLSTWFPNTVVTDADEIQRYYLERYGKDSIMIPYGAEPSAVSTQAVLHELNLQPKKYFLYVSRMEPENNALLVRQSFETLQTSLRLALIGDAPYAGEYIRQVRKTEDPRIVIPGAIFGTGYAELQSHCFAYIHATEVGGTHPALIEAMGRGALVLYLNTPENAEVAGDCGIPFESHNLTEVMEQVLVMSTEEQNHFRKAAQERVRTRYSWEAVTNAYEELLSRLCGAGLK